MVELPALNRKTGDRNPLGVPNYARVVELVDTPDLKSGSFGSVGSTPTARTKQCRRSPIGRGCRFKTCELRVRVPPSVPNKLGFPLSDGDDR